MARLSTGLVLICLSLALTAVVATDSESDGSDVAALHKESAPAPPPSLCAGKQMVKQEKGAIGYLFAMVSILGFGSNFVPIKTINSSDGMHFSVVMTTAVWLVGVCVQLHRWETAVFRPFAMFGGALWATGNVCVSIIVECIGLGMGMLIWGMLNMLTGWASGHFGFGNPHHSFIGVAKETVSQPGLNYAGVALAICSLGIYSFVKTNVGNEEEETDDLADPLIEPKTSEKSIFDKLSSGQKKFLGVGLSVVSGIFYGSNFDPPQHLIDKHTLVEPSGVSCMEDGWSHNSLDYLFSHFCGIFFTTQIYFLVYCCITKNKPFILDSTAFLPAMFSGALWAVAQTCWFMANDKLEFVIAFPLITTGPGIVAALWGIFLYNEISGQRNFMFLGLAICFAIAGVSCIAASK